MWWIHTRSYAEPPLILPFGFHRKKKNDENKNSREFKRTFSYRILSTHTMDVCAVNK